MVARSPAHLMSPFTGNAKDSTELNGSKRVCASKRSITHESTRKLLLAFRFFDNVSRQKGQKAEDRV